MLKHRQDGLVGLHGTVLLLVVSTAFLASRAIAKSTGWIQFTAEVNWLLYFAGMLAAMIWINHHLRGAAERLGALTTAEAGRLTVQQITRLMVVLFTLAFVTKDVDVSRAYLLGFIACAGALLLLANLFGPALLTRLFFRDQRLRTVIVASGDEARLLQRWLAPRHYLGIDALGYVTPAAEPGPHGPDRLGTADELPRLLAALAVDQVVCAQSEHRGAAGAALTRVAERARCRLRFFVNMNSLFGANAGAIEHNEHYAFGSAVMEPLDNPLNQLLKRALDVAISLPVVVFILPPLTLLVWAVQRWQSPGPVFYGQLRSGLNRQRFFIHKFRSMHVTGAAGRAQQATKHDARVFAFGRFLRRTSLDEMPQFLNVLLGSMSVSGPRPHLPEHDAQFAKLVETYYKRHFVKPGITGLAQSKGFRGEVIESSHLTDRVRYDMIYVATWSLGLDLGILFRTVRQVVFPPRSAY
jgi:exopolysaccharide biosynthesis polyprenyl glycosylphosphotransferase